MSTSLSFDRILVLASITLLKVRLSHRLRDPKLIVNISCASCSLPMSSLSCAKSFHSLIHAFRLFLWRLFKSTTTQRRSRHSTYTVPEFHAEAPQATVSERPKVPNITQHNIIFYCIQMRKSMTEINNRTLSQRNTFGHKRGTKRDRGPANLGHLYIILYLFTAKQQSSTINPQEHSFKQKRLCT